MDSLLQVERVSAARGVIRALTDVSLLVRPGERVAVLGPNGAGKTTLLRVVAGLTRLQSGRVQFCGRDLTGLPAHRIARAGIALVPEGRGLFPDLTTEQNLLLGGYGTSPWRRSPEVRRRIDELYERFALLKQLRDRLAGSLSGGQAQFVAIARGLVAHPQLLLLDEPSTGLAPALVAEIAQFIEAASRQGLAILVAEQNLGVALAIAQRLYVLSTGSVVFEAPRSQFLDHVDVFSAYLGRYSTEQAVAMTPRKGD